jgi:O-antigen/teichoic acid export membrane protein
MSLAADEVRRRATSGAVLLAARGGLILVVGIGANIVLARLLEPRDFGLVAIGAVLIVLGGYLVQGGLGAALVQRAEPPTQHELEVVNGLQLAAAGAMTLVFGAVALPFGRDGLVVIVMLSTLPISVLRSPSVVVLERELSYRTIAKVDVLEALAFYAWAIGTVALGFGVWGMATAMVVRALVGTLAMLRLGPLGLVRPRWSWPDARPLLGFGAKLQAVSIVSIIRDQGLNLAIAAVAGAATLGVWSLAYRVLQAPTMVFATVNRVSFPTMARMLGAGRDPRRAIERGVATLTVVAGIVTVAVAGFAPALPALVGDEWGGVPATIAWSCAAILLGAPIYIVAVGYLYAAGRVGDVLGAMTVYAIVWFGLSLPLLPSMGAPAIGLGWLVSAAVNALQLSWLTKRQTGAAIASHLLPPALVGVAAGAVGWWIGTAGSETVPDGILGAASGELVLLGGLALVGRPLLHDAYRLVTEAARGAVAPRA